MNYKKFFGAFLLVVALLLVSNTVLANAEYSAQQITCIKAAQEKRVKTISTAGSNIDIIKKSGLQFQGDFKACLAQNGAVGFFKNILNNFAASLSGAMGANEKSNKLSDTQKACIKTAQDKRASAIEPAAQALKTQTEVASKARQDAMTATLKMKDAKGKAAAIKKASDAFNNAETVKQAKPVYIAAVQAANNQFQTDQKACLASSGLKTLGTGIFKNIKVGFSSSMSSVTKFFTGKK